jgi:hypothetical protein
MLRPPFGSNPTALKPVCGNGGDIPAAAQALGVQFTDH